MPIDVSWSYIVLWCLAIFQLVLSLGLWGELRRRQSKTTYFSKPLELGTVAPRFSGTDLVSGQLVYSHTGQRESLVALFLSAGCSTCSILAENIRAYGGLQNVIGVCNGSIENCSTLAKRLGLSMQVIHDEDGEIKRRFGVQNVPECVFIDSFGRVREYFTPRNATEIANHFSQLEIKEYPGVTGK